MFVFKAAVVGAGTMGGEIAQVIAAAGIPVVLHDVDTALTEVGRDRAAQLTAAALEPQVTQGRITREQADRQIAETVALITQATDYSAFADVDIVIEAVPEEIEVKSAVFAELDATTPGHAILASTTSALSVSELAAATTRPGQVLGLHFFHPASTTRLVEIVEGLETSPEALATAAGFIAAIRRTAIRCVDDPGFVVNRVLAAALGELLLAQEEGGLSIAALDRAVAESAVLAMGPFVRADSVGLDTVLAVAEQLHDAYGDRFHVHAGLAELVSRGELGSKRGRGFYENGRPRTGGAEEFDASELIERFTLRALVESCLVLEDGVAGTREIDLGMTAGAGMRTAPFAGADAAGLGERLAALERAADRWGERFEPPTILRRLVAQGRVGVSEQGFFPRPRPDAGQDGPVKVESRGAVAIAWLDNPPANSLGVEAVHALTQAWRAIAAQDTVRVLVLASANPALFCAGADIKGFAALDADRARLYLQEMHELLQAMGTSSIVTIAAINGLAYGGGCELAMGADVRIAARSASFAQPEIKLGIIPGFGGTQRLPRLVGVNKALEMSITGEPIDGTEAWELGLVNRVVPDHELLDTALAWARRLASAAPLAIAELKRALCGPDLQAGLDAERAAFARVFATADAREGAAAFVERRAPRFTGR